MDGHNVALVWALACAPACSHANPEFADEGSTSRGDTTTGGTTSAASSVTQSSSGTSAGPDTSSTTPSTTTSDSTTDAITSGAYTSTGIEDSSTGEVLDLVYILYETNINIPGNFGEGGNSVQAAAGECAETANELGLACAQKVPLVMPPDVNGWGAWAGQFSVDTDRPVTDLDFTEIAETVTSLIQQPLEAPLSSYEINWSGNQVVWTGYSSQDMVLNCNGWTSNGDIDGAVGELISAEVGWWGNGLQLCGSSHRLLCLCEE